MGKLKTIGLFEAKTRLSYLVELVSKGEEIIITRHDKAVARLIPEGSRNVNDLRLAYEKFKEIRKGITLNLKKTKAKKKISIKELIEEGRK